MQRARWLLLAFAAAAQGPGSAPAPLVLPVTGLEVVPPAAGALWRASVVTAGGGRTDRLVAAGAGGLRLDVRVWRSEAAGCAELIGAALRDPAARIAPRPGYLPSSGWFAVAVAAAPGVGVVCLPLARGALVARIAASALDGADGMLVRPLLAALGRSAAAQWGTGPRP